MRCSTGRRAALIGAMALAASTSAVGAQMHQQGMMQQQHMADMQNMTQRLSGMMQRSQQMQERMRQMSPADMTAQHRMVQEMNGHLGTIMEHMKGSMEQMQTMMMGGDASHDADMDRDMNEMRVDMDAMMKNAERMLKVIERSNARMSAPKRSP